MRPREKTYNQRAEPADVFERQRMTDPALHQRDAITYFSGIRAATYEEDFIIRKGKWTRNIVHAAGIQSRPHRRACHCPRRSSAAWRQRFLSKTREVKPNRSFHPVRTGIVRANELDAQARDALIRQNLYSTARSSAAVKRSAMAKLKTRSDAASPATRSTASSAACAPAWGAARRLLRAAGATNHRA
ncbi:MAG: hypothetical protein R2881_03395 [Eubacteriales bacterium]